MIKILFYLFIFFAPFTSFFAVSGWLRLPVMINQLLLIGVIIMILQKGRLRTQWIVEEDLYLVGFLILVWISFLFGYREQRSFNHSLAYTNSVLFYFFLSKYVITSLKISVNEISKIIYWSFLTSSFIIISDFIGKNYFNYSIRDLFSTVDGATSNMDYFIRAKLFRVGGVAEEPGHMAFFYNIYFGISLYYLHIVNSKLKYSLIIVLFGLAQFAMFSNAGIALPIIAVLFIFVFDKVNNLKLSKRELSSILLLGFSVFLIFFLTRYKEYSQLFQSFIDKTMFDEGPGYTSSGARLHHWSRALTNFVKHPVFGNGPGYGVQEDKEGYLNVYLTILSDVGIVAFLFFLSFQWSIIAKALRSNREIRRFLYFCIITSFLHLFIIADFYNAPLWILFFYIQIVYFENKTSLLTEKHL